MKRLTLCLAILVLALAGCKHETKDFSTHTISGERYWLQVFDEPFIFDEDTLGVTVTYSFEWPDKGMISPESERELQYLCFGDSSAADVNTAIENWLKHPFFYAEENAALLPVENFDDEISCSILEVEGTCKIDNGLATFNVWTEMSPFGAAHGVYSGDNLTVDLETGKAIHLEDLVTDTAMLCEAIAHAIQDLEVNNGIIDCLFDEFKEADRMPLPHNFVIDSARNGITVFYGLYEITPYACGIQEVELPIFWLSKHVPLTPYAKKLFGPESHLE